MTVGFNEERSVEVIDDSGGTGGNEDILAVGNIEEELAMLEATEAGTEVKANAVNVDFGLSILLSDMVDELGIDVVGLAETGPRLLAFWGSKSLHGP